jgi:hypothetical protein
VHAQNHIDGEFVAHPNIPRTSFLGGPTQRPNREPNCVVVWRGCCGAFMVQRSRCLQVLMSYDVSTEDVQLLKMEI